MKKPPATPVDRRVMRTRRALSHAMIELIIARSWDDITVQDLCDRADIGRSTFYLHFANKEELIVGGLDDLRRGLREHSPAARKGGGQVLGFARGLIEHVAEQQRLFRAIMGKRSGHVVQQRFRQMVVRLVKEDFTACAPAGWRRDAAVHYVAGALVDLLTWWLETRSPRDAEEIETLFHQLTAPVVAQLRQVR